MNRYIALGVVCALVGLTPTGWAENWPNWRGPNYDGISRETGILGSFPPGGPPTLWTARVGTGFSTFAVADGRVYTTGNEDNKDTLYCLDAKTGDQKWAFTYPQQLGAKYYEGGPGGSPTVDGDRVYTLSKFGDLFCLDVESGEVKWQKNVSVFDARPPTWGFANSPLIDGDELLIDVGAVLSLDKMSGELNWSSENYGAAYSTVVLAEMDGKEVIVAFPEHGPVVLDRSNGKELAKHRWKTSYGVNDTTPIIRKDKIYVQSGYGTGEGLFQFTGDALNQIWSQKTRHRSAQMSNQIVYKDHMYGFDGTTLRCLELTEMKPTWERKNFCDSQAGTLVIADGKLIILTDKGELALAEAKPDAYNELARAQVVGGKCWTAPVLANQILYVRNARGDVKALDFSQ